MRIHRELLVGVAFAVAIPAFAQRQQAPKDITPPPPPKVTQSTPLTAVMPSPVTAPPPDRPAVVPNVVADPTKFSPVSPLSVDVSAAQTPGGSRIGSTGVPMGQANAPASPWDKLNAPTTNAFTAPSLQPSSWNAPPGSAVPSVNWQNTGTPASQWK